MTIARSLWRTTTLEFMDAVGSSRWDTTIGGVVDQWIARAYDQEWRTILDANPYVRVDQLKNVNTNPTGEIQKAALTSGTGDTTTRLYKIVSVLVNNLILEQVHFSDYSRAIASGANISVYYEFGDIIQILPASQSLATVTYTTLPQVFTSLATDASLPVFPTGFEDVPCLEAAAMLLMKGGAESDAAAGLRAIATSRRNDMQAALGRPSLNPLRIKSVDTPSIWGE